MLARVISSLQHPIVKKICKLRTDSQFRKEENLTVLTSDVIIKEVNQSKEIDTLLYTSACSFHEKAKAKEKICVTNEILEKCQGFKSQDTCLALIQLPQNQNHYAFPWVILDSIQDPGNLGTLMRSALAFGFKTMILTPGSCDPFNEKVNKGARGANFHIELHSLNQEQILDIAKTKKANLYFADASGQNVEKVEFSKNAAIILGNEGHGVSEKLRKPASPIAIQMEKLSESLNVAIAGSIIMYHIYKG